MKYEIGDKVRFLCDKVPWTDIKIPPNAHGIIMGRWLGTEADLRIRMGNPARSWRFSQEDIEPYAAPMTAPDMELDEIHKAKKLMEKLK